MEKISIALPKKIIFSTTIDVQIQHINYGNHMSNSAYLDIAHEARLRFLKSLSYSEMDFGGKSLIMGNAAIQFKKEVFYADKLAVQIGLAHLSNISFDLIYQLERSKQDILEPVAVIKTGMICFDYQAKKVGAIPEHVRDVFLGFL